MLKILGFHNILVMMKFWISQRLKFFSYIPIYQKSLNQNYVSLFHCCYIVSEYLSKEVKIQKSLNSNSDSRGFFIAVRI